MIDLNSSNIENLYFNSNVVGLVGIKATRSVDQELTITLITSNLMDTLEIIYPQYWITPSGLLLIVSTLSWPT